ncbi:MAG TPA: LssY C-terminal domain-containing protein [Steroidobacteraceae bacterium]|nr:LssY C-terminal domain-containing protein [Steroidobacteraceae bacterium]
MLTSNALLRASLALLLLGFLAGCGGTAALAPAVPARLDRIQSETRDGVTVEVAIPTREEADGLFGVPFAEFAIQPIWVDVRNESAEGLWLLAVAIDPEYYSADEAAELAGGRLDDESRAELRQRLRNAAMPLYVPAGGRSAGYVYASGRKGGRLVDVRLVGHEFSVRMRFAVLLPEAGLDYHESGLGQRYRRIHELPSVGLDELRERLEALPCCTTNEDGTSNGDPLNLVIVGPGEDGIAALLASGWDFTEAVSLDSIRRMVGAAIAENRYLTAPVSSLYAFGREQDAALQQGRSTISQRNHMRLWIAPFRYEGQPVWVGQVSRDVGVKLTSRSASLTTHVIDPAVDEAREHVMQGLLFVEAVERFAFVGGVGAATAEAPRENLTGDPYFTDGNRLVVFVSEQPVPPESARNLRWKLQTDPIREAQRIDADVPLESREEAGDASR